MTSFNRIIEQSGEEIPVQADQVSRFQQEIEKLVEGGASYMEAVVEYCTANDIEIETVESLVSAPLYDKLFTEAKGLRLIHDDTQTLQF